MNITDAAYWMKNDENISSDDNDEEMNARDCFSQTMIGVKTNLLRASSSASGR